MGNLFDGTEGEPRTTDKKGSGTDNNVSDRTKSGGRRESVQADKGVRADNDMGSTENASVSKQRKPEGRKQKILLASWIMGTDQMQEALTLFKSKEELITEQIPEESVQMNLSELIQEIIPVEPDYQ